MSLNLTKTVTAFLAERPDQKFTARQIAEWVFENFPEECQDKKDRSLSLGSDDELLQQLVREITAQHSRILKKTPPFEPPRGVRGNIIPLKNLSRMKLTKLKAALKRRGQEGSWNTTSTLSC